MLFSKLFTAVLAAAAGTSVYAAPAPADEPTSPKPADGEYCTKSIERYSNGGRIVGTGEDAKLSSDWARFRHCLRVSNSRASIVTYVEDVQYKWGGAWYRPNGVYNYKWDVDAFYLEPDDDESKLERKGVNASPITVDVGTFAKPIKPGSYVISIGYGQEGPYWDGYYATIGYREAFTFDIPAA